MLTLAFILLGLFLAVAQTTVLMPTPTWPVSPDLHYILAAYLAYQFDPCRSTLILLPLSCVLDVYSGTVIGLHPALCGCGYLLLRVMAVKMPVRKSLYQIPLIALSYLLVAWLVVLLLSLLQPEAGLSWNWLTMLLRAGLIYLLSFPLFRFFSCIDRQLRGRLSDWTSSPRSRLENQFRQEREMP
jgi:rod shape-determining protein MreD